MRTIAALALMVMSIASVSVAQYEEPWITVSAVYPPAWDAPQCILDEGLPHECFVYVVLENVRGISAAFRIDDTHSTLVRLNTEIHPPVFIGDVFTGISLGFGGCIPVPYLMLTLTYLCEGTSPPCTWITVAPHPLEGGVLVADCTPITPNVMIASVNQLCINEPCLPVPVEPTTWGQIKALYE